MKKVSKVTIIISLLIIGFSVAGIKIMHKPLNVVHTPVPTVINLNNKTKTKKEIHATYFPPGVSPSTKDISLLLLQKEQISKGGVIGTNGKGVVAIRFDDYQNIFGEKIFPLMVARGLPCSMSLISRFRTAQPWGMKTTWSEVRNWNRNGVEIWSHGTNHKNYTLKKFGSLYDEVVNSKKEIEAQNIKVVGFVLPGVAPIPGQAPLYNGLLKPSDYNSTAGKLLMQTYAITEAYAYKSSTRILPTYIYHGLNHYTVSDGLGSLANAESLINIAIKNKTGIELMCHPGSLGKPGHMTLSEFTTLLDYIKMKWDNNSIDVLTPSGLYFANTNISTRLKLTTDDSFEGLTVDKPGAWDTTTQWSGKTIETSGGRTGKNFLRINSRTTNSAVTQEIIHLGKLKVLGEQFVFEGWIRPYGMGSTTGMVKIKDSNNYKELRIVKGVVSKGSSWTRVRFVFCIPPNTKNITLSLYRSAGAGIDWDDVSIKKI